MLLEARTLEEIIKGVSEGKRLKEVQGRSLGDEEVGASKGDREGATTEVGEKPGEGGDDPGAEWGEMNSYMLSRSMMVKPDI